jgi:dienelactone hydrolase
MRYLRSIGFLTAVFLIVSVMSVAAASAGTRINFSSLDPNQHYNVYGTLYLPENNSSPSSAIVMVHGTSEINSVGVFYREAILNAGIAIFEVDFKTGIFTGPMDRPPIDTFLPLVFAALKELRKLPTIDPNRIGIMGFSMGGAVTLRTAMESNRKPWMRDEKGFAAYAAFYPVTKPFIPVLEKNGSKLTGGPMIIFYGTADYYGDGEGVPELKSLLARKYNFEVTTVEYAGAAHGFNRNEQTISYRDPAAIGQKGFMTWNPDAANDSLTKVVAFLRENLAAN